MQENKKAIRLLLAANIISGISQGITMLAIPWYFSGMQQQSGLFAKIYVFSNFLSLFWGLYAGTLVDRYNRKHLFLGINVAGMLLIGGVAAYGWWQGSLSWVGPAIAFLTTVFIYNVHFPAMYAFAQEITPKEEYKKITSLLEIQGQITWTISGGLAAVLLSGFDGIVTIGTTVITLPFTIAPWKIYEVFTLDAATYVVALLLIATIAHRAVIARNTDTTALHRRLLNGIHYLRQHKPMFIFGNASLFVFLSILIHSTIINPLYVTHYLHKSAGVYASADMVFSMGALLAGFFAAKIIRDEALITSIIFLNCLAAIMFTVHVFNQNMLWYFFTYFIIGMCNSAIRIQRVTYFFHHISNDIIGRTGSVFFMLNVVERMLLTALLSLPFFQTGGNIAYANGILAVICLSGAFLIFIYKKELNSTSIVAESEQ